MWRKNKKSRFVRNGVFKEVDEPRPDTSRRTRRSDKKNEPCLFRQGSLKKGDDILSHITAVPSAQAGLTSLFGMGRGEPRRNNHLKAICLRS